MRLGFFPQLMDLHRGLVSWIQKQMTHTTTTKKNSEEIPHHCREDDWEEDSVRNYYD